MGKPNFWRSLTSLSVNKNTLLYFLLTFLLVKIKEELIYQIGDIILIYKFWYALCR